MKFAVIGDTCTGDANQYRTAEKLVAFRSQFANEFVVMLGDNTYGGESPKDFERRFEIPYKPLLDAGVKFHAAIGNHDTPNQRFYKLFNMGGQQYYSFRPKPGRAVFCARQQWRLQPGAVAVAAEELAASGSEWKIAFFHHPLYSSGGRHGSDTALREQLEPPSSSSTSTWCYPATITSMRAQYPQAAEGHSVRRRGRQREAGARRHR